MDYKLNNDRIVIEVEPVKLQTISEPYVVSTPFGYQVAIDVFETKKKRKKSLLLAAKSLFTELESLRGENNGKLNGLEFWVNKESAEKKSKYVIR